LNNWRLDNCDLYVTLEPCLMCCGAIIQSRIAKVYYGATDKKGGGVESLCYSFDLQGLNHYVKHTGGIMAEECEVLLKDYFKRKR
ncbi:nucleoside deaminase, partial [bacterium]|nr:nucleoside deaminase [bacterium]